jgi:hypothetical protein
MHRRTRTLPEPSFDYFDDASMDNPFEDAAMQSTQGSGGYSKMF